MQTTTDSALQNVRSFKGLEAWKEARVLVKSIYELTKGFPRDEIFGLTSQMRRASVSVAGNIAEGFGRISIKEKLQFYNLANGSLTELHSHLFLSNDLSYISNEYLEVILTQLIKTQSILQGLIRSTRKRL